MTVNHTPGPWKIVNDSDGWHVLSPDDKNIAEFIVDKDDARLIAAAPDMLQALKKIRMTYRGNSNQLILTDWQIKEICDATIAKAEGRE